MGIPLYGECRDSGPTKEANSSASFHATDPVRFSEEWCVHSFHVILFFMGFGCGLWQAVIDFRCWSALASNSMMRKRKRWREMHLQFPIKRPLCSPSLPSPPSTPAPRSESGSDQHTDAMDLCASFGWTEWLSGPQLASFFLTLFSQPCQFPLCWERHEKKQDQLAEHGA